MLVVSSFYRLQHRCLCVNAGTTQFERIQSERNSQFKGQWNLVPLKPLNEEFKQFKLDRKNKTKVLFSGHLLKTSIVQKLITVNNREYMHKFVYNMRIDFLVWPISPPYCLYSTRGVWVSDNSDAAGNKPWGHWVHTGQGLFITQSTILIN